jgi:hypothetical protein
LRVRLFKKDGSIIDSQDLPEPVAQELHGRYFSAINGINQPMMGAATLVVTVSGDTYGLPGAWGTGQMTGVGLV